MKREIIATEKAQQHSVPYSQAVKAGKFIFVSGQIPIDSSTGKLVGEGIEEQTRQVLENIKAILEVAGASLDEIVKVTVFIKDMDDFVAMNKVYAQYFSENFPVRCFVQVSKLPMDVKLEFEAVAALGVIGQVASH
ncbi:MAG: RidA family protein [Dehalococcoidia bacterium]|nr:RidA family protein [Dehalococcoidia bacterium]